jgi:hypothetical protein
VTIEEAAEHQGERVTWHGPENLTEEGLIYHVSANFAFVRRPGDLNGATASHPAQLTLIADTGRLF